MQRDSNFITILAKCLLPKELSICICGRVFADGLGYIVNTTLSWQTQVALQPVTVLIRVRGDTSWETSSAVSEEIRNNPSSPRGRSY